MKKLDAPAALEGCGQVVIQKWNLCWQEFPSDKCMRSSLPKGGHGGLPALEPLVLLLEWMHGRCGCPRAIGLPFLVLLLVLRPVGRASSICGDVEGLNASDASHVQAGLCEQVLTHWSILAILDTNLPIDL